MSTKNKGSSPEHMAKMREAAAKARAAKKAAAAEAAAFEKDESLEMTHAEDTHETDSLDMDEWSEDWVMGNVIPELETKHPKMGYRWIRVSITGKADNDNISKQMKNWKPVPAKECPPSMTANLTQFGAKGEVIQVGDLVLCWAPKALIAKRDAKVRARTMRQQTIMEQSELAGAASNQVAKAYGRPEVIEDTTQATSRPARSGLEIAAD